MSQYPDQRCPKCGYTMCELFDYEAASPIAFSATANGRYQCYHCTPVGAVDKYVDWLKSDRAVFASGIDEC
jgi:hypothetical protein